LILIQYCNDYYDNLFFSSVGDVRILHGVSIFGVGGLFFLLPKRNDVRWLRYDEYMRKEMRDTRR
jgi:hypothetical protein